MKKTKTRPFSWDRRDSQKNKQILAIKCAAACQRGCERDENKAQL